MFLCHIVQVVGERRINIGDIEDYFSTYFLDLKEISRTIVCWNII
jgi:hypothetical protein